MAYVKLGQKGLQQAVAEANKPFTITLVAVAAAGAAAAAGGGGEAIGCVDEGAILCTCRSLHGQGQEG